MNTDDILDRTLITGASGMGGSYIDFGIKLDHRSLDVGDLDKCQTVVSHYKPKVIIHLAALTDLNVCEEEPDLAYKINSLGTYNLALAAKAVGAKMVYVSTDAVFPSSRNPHMEEEEPNPKSVYGHSKYLGELAVRGICSNFLIVRTSWVFGGGKERDKKFVGKFISELEKPEAKAVNDEFSSPTFALDLAHALEELILEGQTGVHHVVNSGVASRYDMALMMKEALQKDTNIVPVSSSLFGLKSYQHASGGLVGDLQLRSWQEALSDYLQEEWVSVLVK